MNYSSIAPPTSRERFVGLPDNHRERVKHSLGTNLVNGLARQLEGNIEWSATPKGGTTVGINF